MARSGYTLPVFAVAAAKAALLHLLTPSDPPSSVELDLLPTTAQIPIQQGARLQPNSALAITLSDPGDNLDLTRYTPLWAWVQLQPRQDQPLVLQAGEGLGKTLQGEAAIYSYARRLFAANLLPLIPPEQTAIVTIILPEGRQLAQRTSNAAFGIIEGLALLGTSGISQPLSVADHFEALRQELQSRQQSRLVFCIGSNGKQVAERLGLDSAAIVSTGNWIGALLVQAGSQGAESVLLLGYQGKLVKLAGGIFNTSSHLADAKLEIISAAVIQTGGDLTLAQAVLAAQTADAAYKLLIDAGRADAVFSALAAQISHRATAYVQKYANTPLTIGTVLFDRQGQLIGQDATAQRLLEAARSS
ncbi:MAG: cobalt-precorrin-5B (C(1))-methyltransferase [Synechococcales cyanobacterium M58_A2018_015]|nr:cobalt-precorrin-5B (C(1))-methyltransferase [Synechococcales cyanobacterium M58_A2018_015]